MDVFEAIKGRRSVRKYKLDNVPNEVIEKILDAARWAPSGSNLQPWRFIVIRDRNLVELVRKVSPGYLGEAPLAILVCSDKERAYRVGGILGRDYLSVSDCSMAVENMLLAAYALGLGTCVVKSFSHTAIRELLEIPEGIEPELLVIMGYPAHTPTPPARIPLAQIAYLNKYGLKYPTSMEG
ncbi:MAG: nitroreductase family protein [Candidatus Bathycorpusculaceae bacterium]